MNENVMNDTDPRENGEGVESNENENNENNENENKETVDVSSEEEIEIEEVEEYVDQDEEIIRQMYDSGKFLVTSSELIKAGIDQDRLEAYGFQIGEYRLTRSLLVSPFTIEKIDTED